MGTMIDFSFELTHFFDASVVDVGCIDIAMSPFALIEVDGQKLCAYLSDKVIEAEQLYTAPLEGSHYSASIKPQY